MLKGKAVESYLIELIKELGWNEALEKFQSDVKSGKIETTGKKNSVVVSDNDDNDDDWVEDRSRDKLQETYFIVVKDFNTGEKETILVDECDFNRVFEYDWWIRRDDNGFKVAVTNIDGKFISIQQFILGIPKFNRVIVFKDRNRLNAKRNNMKIVVANKIDELRFKHRHGYNFDD